MFNIFVNIVMQFCVMLECDSIVNKLFRGIVVSISFMLIFCIFACDLVINTFLLQQIYTPENIHDHHHGENNTESI